MHERRKNKRYFLDKNCFLTHLHSVGVIVDIGMGGLSCMCPKENKCDIHELDKGINIHCQKSELVVRDFSVKVVNTLAIPDQSGGDLKFRKCNVKFNRLEQKQKINLIEVILLHATPSASESYPRSPS